MPCREGVPVRDSNKDLRPQGILPSQPAKAWLCSMCQSVAQNMMEAGSQLWPGDVCWGDTRRTGRGFTGDKTRGQRASWIMSKERVNLCSTCLSAQP